MQLNSQIMQEVRAPSITKEHRTAKAAGVVARMPENIAIITKAEYQNALKCCRRERKNENAYLLQMAENSSLSFEDGIAYIFGQSAKEVEFINYSTNERIDEIDMSFLMAVYSVIYMNLSDVISDISSEEELKQKLTSYSVDIYIPDFLKFMGSSCKYSKNDIEMVCNKIKRFQNVVGITETVFGNHTYADGYMLLVTLAIKESTNTITVMSPYMNMLIYKILRASVDKDKNGIPKINKNGTMKMLPAYSFQDARLASAKNKKAVEIVCAVVALVEQTGSKGIPHIKVRNIIEQCPSLVYSLQITKSDSNKTKVLRRSFSTAWEYIIKYTDLLDKYIDFVLPSTTPTINTLDMVLTFSHKGKVRKK